MHNNYVIRLESVSKIYKLHGSQRDQLVDVLGLHRIGLKPSAKPKEFVALDNINLEVPRGHRIGIVGRNGAGKTTLLKLLCGNFAPTHGKVEVNGEVQALMNVGLGFHPEYTGRENVEASLQYNGLDKSEYEEALDGIINFCELGDFFDQPFKTYSLGMQARLMFASATAIRPDILIVDEVLGAGDAYFVAKSKSRVEKLISSGCTMLLVSHSMQQVLELCTEAIWLDKGAVRMRGDAFDVVKKYEEFLHGPIRAISDAIDVKSSDQIIANVHGAQPHVSNEEMVASINEERFRNQTVGIKHGVQLQEPVFHPHAANPEFPCPEIDATTYDFVASGGVSRWDSSMPGKLAISGFSIVNSLGKTNELVALQPVKFCLIVEALESGNYSCRYAVNISNHFGQTLLSIKSPADRFHLIRGTYRRVELVFNPLQLGPGEYTVSIAILEYGRIEHINHAGRYDLLSRSFQFKVQLPSSWLALNSQFFHSAEWYFDRGLSE
jgi:lipopolysaccharide transport system ATP-binding protein